VIYESRDIWLQRGRELFGDDFQVWRFRCPICHRVQTIGDFRKFKDLGASPDSAAQECIGRYTGGMDGPDGCDWAAYGLFRGPDMIQTAAGPIGVFEFDTEGLA
jgi:hypothetical protein